MVDKNLDELLTMAGHGPDMPYNRMRAAAMDSVCMQRGWFVRDEGPRTNADGLTFERRWVECAPDDQGARPDYNRVIATLADAGLWH